ncbi:MAG: hypothetical protein K0R18_142 [Bacillales bacterium]|jgi:hypothetical protein|nr:hypothetical protein [Bacillales bacterium]
MAQDDRLVAILFRMNNNNYTTLLDGRSRNRFKKLITNWAPIDGEIITRPDEKQSFTYVELNFVLEEIENTYKELMNTPAIEKIAEKVFSIINTVRAQNNSLDELEYDDSDGDDD